MEDRELASLLTEAQRGGQAALDQFVRLTQDRVYRLALCRLRRRDLADDATQETFARLLQRLDRWHGGDGLAWVLAIARNVIRETLRRAGREAKLRLVRPHDGPADPAEASMIGEQHQALWQAIRRLPPRQHEVIALRAFEQLSVERTAAAMRCRPGTVKALMHKAVGNLRKQLT